MGATGFAMAYKQFVHERLAVAKELAERRGQYVADAGVILGALISSLSSDAYEKTRDRQRFVELLVNEQTAGRESQFRAISLASLKKKYPNALKCDPAQSDTISCHPNIDAKTKDTMSEEEICKKAGLKTDEIRKHSYAVLLYEGLRCSYLHEYRAGHCTLYPDTSAPLPNLVMYNGKGDIFFSLHHCADMIEKIAENLAANARCGNGEYADLRFPTPQTFWWD